MKGLDKLKKLGRPALVDMAKKLGCKTHSGLNKTQLASRILKKQKLSELEEPGPSIQPELELEPESERKPEFESLATEAPEIEPELPQDEKQGPGGYREGAGRTPGLTDEKARVQRVLGNEVPDPTIKFAFECLFDGWESAVGVKGIALSKDEVTLIAVPTTNLKEYYFPGLNISPALELWIGLAIGVKAIVQSRIALIRETRKAEPVTESVEPGDEQKT
ncbi:hypothetical protein LCGC14_0840670 [marine sediment metagenome]|uniref:Uncharacterized protein n=1 Tax=marine sediment metagenome TaxID=412755 RepID=A0A0F9PHZ2_9ZZZZ